MSLLAARQAVARHGALEACVLLAACGLLAACATRPPPSQDMPWTSGRLSVQVAADGARAARNVSAGFDLRGNAERGELRLTSPLGSLVAAARWWPGSAVLQTPQGQVDFPDLDSLSNEALGESLPLQALPDWLAGRPWLGASSQPLEAAQGAGFEQLGWRVLLARLDEGHLDAERLAPPVVKLRVRLEKP